MCIVLVIQKLWVLVCCGCRWKVIVLMIGIGRFYRFSRQVLVLVWFGWVLLVSVGLLCLLCMLGSSRLMLVSSVVVVFSLVLDLGSRCVVSWEVSRVCCCSELCLVVDSVGVENILLVSIRLCSVVRFSWVIVVCRLVIVWFWLKKVEFDSCSILVVMVGLVVISLVILVLLVLLLCFRVWVRFRYRCGGDGSFLIWLMVLCRCGLFSILCSFFRLVNVFSSIFGVSGSGRKWWVILIRCVGGGWLLWCVLISVMWMVFGCSVWIWFSSVVVLRLGNCGQMIIVFMFCVVIVVIVVWLLVVVSGCQFFLRLVMNLVSLVGRLVVFLISRICMIYFFGCFDDGC